MLEYANTEQRTALTKLFAENTSTEQPARRKSNQQQPETSLCERVQSSEKNGAAAGPEALNIEPMLEYANTEQRTALAKLSALQTPQQMQPARQTSERQSPETQPLRACAEQRERRGGGV